VDFNSVGVTQTTAPRAAMTMMGEDFSPTVISGGSTSTEIVNVCKECGASDQLYNTRDHFIAALEAAKSQDLRRHKQTIEIKSLGKITLIGASLGFIVTIGLYFIFEANSGDDWRAYIVAGLIGSFVAGFLSWLTAHNVLWIRKKLRESGNKKTNSSGGISLKHPPGKKFAPRKANLDP
jgi:hypothetical protein